MTICAVMQGPDVISIVYTPGVSVTILNVTNAVVSGVGPTSVTNLTTVNSIPQGSYGNFSAIVNASSQVTCSCPRPVQKNRRSCVCKPITRSPPAYGRRDKEALVIANQPSGKQLYAAGCFAGELFLTQTEVDSGNPPHLLDIQQLPVLCRHSPQRICS